MKRSIIAFLALAFGGCSAFAQSSPGWSYGYVPTAAEWNAAFASKQDALNFTPLNIAGGTMLGKLNLAPSRAFNAGLNMSVGVAPTTPINGDIWATSAGIYAYINNAIVGPFGVGSINALIAGAGLTGGTCAGPACTIALNYASASIWTAAQTINVNAAPLPAAQAGTVLRIGQASGVMARMEADSWGASAYFSCIRTDGTIAAPTALQAGEEMCGLNSWGYATSVVGPRAAFRTYADQTWTNTNQGTYADIAVTPDNSTVLTEVMKFGNDGGVVVNSATGGDEGPGTVNAAGFYVGGNAPSGTGSIAMTSGAALTNPTATTQTTADTSTLVATDAFVHNVIGATGVSSFNSRTGAVVPATGDYTTQQLTPITSGTPPAAGKIGQVISGNTGSGSGKSLATGIVGDVPFSPLPLTAGSWTCNGNVGASPGTADTITGVSGWISLSSATLPTQPNGGAEFLVGGISSVGTVLYTISDFPVDISTGTSVYLSGTINFSGTNNSSLFGAMNCVRKG